MKDGEVTVKEKEQVSYSFTRLPIEDGMYY
jgi:hypothetical protein